MAAEKKSKNYYSKILLFGEYSVIKHSMALSIPYSLFEGELSFKRERNKTVDLELKSFCNYLEVQQKKGVLGFSIDLNSFSFDVGQGLFFDSSIPQGFGVGSSGALCAAVYQAYTEQDQKKSMQEMKKDFAIMENHFHGSSSGIDPLISYINEPILNRNNGEIITVKIPQFESANPQEGGIFLLNTGRPRRTEPLVDLFLEKCKLKEFSEKIENKLLKINDNCITSLLESNVESLYSNFEELSSFQYDEFAPMIPNLFRDLWREGLLSKKYFFKLCGAGGGGFLLGMTRNFKKAEESLQGHDIRPLIRFP